jgi:hypothetical protein
MSIGPRVPLSDSGPVANNCESDVGTGGGLYFTSYTSCPSLMKSSIMSSTVLISSPAKRHEAKKNKSYRVSNTIGMVFYMPNGIRHTRPMSSGQQNVQRLSSRADVPNHVSPVATLSMFSCGRFWATKSRNKLNTSSMSCLDFCKSSEVTFLKGVSVRLLKKDEYCEFFGAVANVESKMRKVMSR